MKSYAFFPGCAYKNAAGYKESIEALNQKLDIHLLEIPDWNCCGATAGLSIDEQSSLVLCARLFSIVENSGFNQIITVCNACYSSLLNARKTFQNSPKKFSLIHHLLSEDGLSFSLRSMPVIRHYLDVIVDDIEVSWWSDRVINTVWELNIGVYYGCQYARPSCEANEIETTSKIETFLKILNFNPVEHSAKTMCCGASHAITYARECHVFIDQIMNEIVNKGANIITTICPMCQFVLDSCRTDIKSNRVPITYFTQIVGLAIGLSLESVGMNKLLTSTDGILA